MAAEDLAAGRPRWKLETAHVREARLVLLHRGEGHGRSATHHDLHPGGGTLPAQAREHASKLFRVALGDETHGEHRGWRRASGEDE